MTPVCVLALLIQDCGPEPHHPASVAAHCVSCVQAAQIKGFTVELAAHLWIAMHCSGSGIAPPCRTDGAVNRFLTDSAPAPLSKAPATASPSLCTSRNKQHLADAMPMRFALAANHGTITCNAAAGRERQPALNTQPTQPAPEGRSRRRCCTQPSSLGVGWHGTRGGLHRRAAAAGEMPLDLSTLASVSMCWGSVGSVVTALLVGGAVLCTSKQVSTRLVRHQAAKSASRFAACHAEGAPLAS